MTILDVTNNGNFTLGGAVFSLKLTETEKSLLINVLSDYELPPEEKEKTRELINVVLKQIPEGVLRELTATQLNTKLNASNAQEAFKRSTAAGAYNIKPTTTIQKHGWVYHTKPDVLGYKDLTFNSACPCRAAIINVLKESSDKITQSEALEAMLWLADNPFNRMPKETLENAFQIFDKDAQNVFFRMYKRIKYGSTVAGLWSKDQKTSAPQIL